MQTLSITRGTAFQCPANSYLGAIGGGSLTATIDTADGTIQQLNGGGNYEITLGGFVPLEDAIMSKTKGQTLTISGTGTVTGYFFNLL